MSVLDPGSQMLCYRHCWCFYAISHQMTTAFWWLVQPVPNKRWTWWVCVVPSSLWLRSLPFATNNKCWRSCRRLWVAPCGVCPDGGECGLSLLGFYDVDNFLTSFDFGRTLNFECISLSSPLYVSICACYHAWLCVYVLTTYMCMCMHTHLCVCGVKMWLHLCALHFYFLLLPAQGTVEGSNLKKLEGKLSPKWGSLVCSCQVNSSHPWVIERSVDSCPTVNGSRNVFLSL